MRAEEVLPDNVNEVELSGVSVRKGSVGAFLLNAQALSDPATTEEARTTVLRDIEEGLPALRALGLFDVFEIREPMLRSFVETH